MRIGAGEAVLTIERAANKDPQAFPDSERLDVTRTGQPHVSFSHGIHFCLGAALARLELQIALDALVRRLPTLRLAVPRHELRWQPDRLIYGPIALPLTWT